MIVKSLVLLVLTCSVLFIASIGSIMWYQRFLYAYLKKHKYERWRDLTSIGEIGPGGMNSFKGIKYIYSHQDKENEEILRLKDKLRVNINFFCIVVLTSFISCFVLYFVK